MRNQKWTLWVALASATVLLGACGQSGTQETAQSQPATAEAPSAPAETSAPAAPKAQPAETASVSESAPGAMGAKAAPEQPKPPADKGAELYGQCVGCHGPSGGGGVGPRLAGQSADALIQKLKDYKAGKQLGPQTAMMAPIAQGLSDADIEAVANYIANHFK